MSTLSCPRCASGTLSWTSRVTKNSPVDVLSCASCGHIAAEEDWVVPMRLPRPGGCCNCGGLRKNGVCSSCGLSADEDELVHRELRDLIDLRSTMFAAARIAAEAGRKLMALKLATAAYLEDPSLEAPRALRLELLRALGATEDALSDARSWIGEEGANSPLAWTAYGELLRELGRKGEAVEALRHTLDIVPHQHMVRAKLAELLLSIDRYAMAKEEALGVVRVAPESDAAELALSVLGQYLRRLIQQQDFTEVQTVLVDIGPPANREANLLCGLAWMAYFRQEPEEIERNLKAAYRLEPENELCKDLERRAMPKKKAWWKWS